MLKPTKILVPTDFSEYSDRALRQAFDIAKEYQAKIFVVHVMIDFREEFDHIFRREAEEMLQKQIGKYPQAKEVEMVAGIRKGIVYEEILKEAKEKGIDLIVIASLGRSGIAKYLMGSVARNVLKGSKCPVLLIK